MNAKSENPPFNFEDARRHRAGDPASSEAAKLRRGLRQLVEAHKSGRNETVQAALKEAELLLAE